MSSDYADILRTLTDVFGGLSLIVRVVVSIDALQGFHAHGEKTRCLPHIGSGLHEPCRRRVPHRVRGDPSDTSTLAGGGKALLNVLDALTMDVQHIAQIGPALPGSAKVRQKARRDLDDAALFIGP